MGIIQSLVTFFGVVGLIGLLLVLCHNYIALDYIPGWTFTRNYLLSSTKEEKMVLTKPAYSSSGCMIPSSDSDFSVSGRGSFLGKTDYDYSLLRQGSSSSLLTLANIPPQPLRPAPTPPHILQPQSSLDYHPVSPLTFAPATIPQPGNSVASAPRGAGEGPSFPGFSNNNPFLPLIQASTQFFTQKLQSFQNGANSNTDPNPEVMSHPKNQSKPFPSNDSRSKVISVSEVDETSSVQSSSNSTSAGGLSMGEILFSSPPAYSLSSELIQSHQSLDKTDDIPHQEEHKDSSVPGQPQGFDSKHNFSVTNDPPEPSDNSRVSSHTPQPNIDHTEDKKPSLTNLCTKSTPDHQSSPSRLRDRQRKMELTLQHLQNNLEDRIMSKKHHSLDSRYPLPTSYVPKVGPGTDTLTSGPSKSRFRSPYTTGHRSVPPPPPLREADELTESNSTQSCSVGEAEVKNSTKFCTNLFNLKGDGFGTNKWILESMREEIRLENERMEDATKSLMEDDFSTATRKTNGLPTLVQSDLQNTLQTSHLDLINSKCSGESGAGAKVTDPRTDDFVTSAETSESGAPTAQSQTENGSTSPPNSTGRPGGSAHLRNIRSFSLRQSSTDSAGSEGSDVGSPDGSLPSLQRAMSCDSVSSDTSVVLDPDQPHTTGQLCVGLEYDRETADLLVNVIEAKELVGPDPAPFDSYVRVYLLPDKTTNMQTRVYRKSLNPVYREKFMFGLETMELPLRTLVFYLYSTDKHSNTLIGETEVKLGDLDIYQPMTTWLQLTDMGQRGGESGEVMFSLSYLPTAERLTVVIVKARNLKFLHERVTGDPFAKVYLLQKGKKVSKKKSSTKRGERNPIFNEAMIFSVPAHALQTIQLRITLADSSEMEGRANSIGHVIVGSSAAGKPLSHWNQMLSSLRKPIAMWHPLRK